MAWFAALVWAMPRGVVSVVLGLDGVDVRVVGGHRVMVSETTAMVLDDGTQHTMALEQSALLELLEVLKAADVDERIRSAATTIYQASIDAELTAVIGAAPHERTDNRTAQRNGYRARR